MVRPLCWFGEVDPARDCRPGLRRHVRHWLRQVAHLRWRHLRVLVPHGDTAAADAVSIRIWKVADLRKPEARAASRSIQFPEVASAMALALNEDGTRLAVSTTLGPLSLWDVTTGRQLASTRAPGWTSGLRFRPGHEDIIGVRSDESVRLWRYEDGTGR